MKFRLIAIMSIIMLVIFLLPATYSVSSSGLFYAYTPEAYMTIGVEMYELNAFGDIPPNKTPCAYGNTHWGCTAFCDNKTNGVLWDVCKPDNIPVTPTPYNYLSYKPTVPIETDYLLDVVAQEMSVSASTIALQAQAIASRSFAQYYNENHPVIPTQVPFNNSTTYQAFIPFKFESLNLTPISNPNNPCQSMNLNAKQRKICEAIQSEYYIAYFTVDSPAKASFSSDIVGQTQNALNDKPYFVGVPEPISTICDSTVDPVNFYGMSQEGAMR